MYKAQKKKEEIRNFLEVFIYAEFIIKAKMTTSYENVYIHFMVDKSWLYFSNRMKEIVHIIKNKYKEIPINIKIYDYDWKLLREYA